MKILLKNGWVYTPEFLGKKDVLIENGKIVYIKDYINEECQTIDCQNKKVCPMFVDGHENITRTAFYDPKDIINSGVGSVVGVLTARYGQNYVDQNIEVAKWLASTYGLDAFALAGSKNYRENVARDIVQNDNVVGVKTALNSKTVIKKGNPTYEELKELSLQTFKAGERANKRVQVHVHLETEFENLVDSNLTWIDKIVEETGVPYSLFKLTHAQKYGAEIIKYANKGCFIDYNAYDGEYDGWYDDLLDAVIKQKVDLTKISFSSDLGVLNIERNYERKETPITLLQTIKVLVKEKGLKFEEVLPFVTTNAGAPINDKLGRLEAGSTAKVLVLDKKFNIDTILFNDNIIKTERNITL